MIRLAFLPPHDFHIGEDDEAHPGQLPNFRLIAFHVIGSDGSVNTIDTGAVALGGLVRDACLKLLRPWSMKPGARFFSSEPNSLIADIADGLLALSPRASTTRTAFLWGMGNFLDIALHCPERMPVVVANIDALTNARLTERARAILVTGSDVGARDLW